MSLRSQGFQELTADALAASTTQLKQFLEAQVEPEVEVEKPKKAKPKGKKAKKKAKKAVEKS